MHNKIVAGCNYVVEIHQLRLLDPHVAECPQDA